MDNEFKPCPFCGGEAVFIECSEFAGYIRCKEFCCEQSKAMTKPEATREWNERCENG